LASISSDEYIQYNQSFHWKQVGELFKAAGQAFSQLGDQALQVHSLSEWQHSSG